MLKQILAATALALTISVLAPARADAYGAAHVGYTRVTPTGVYHTGATAVSTPYGSYSGHAAAYGGAYGAHYGTASGYHYGATYGGAQYTPGHPVSPYQPPVYAPRYYGSYGYVR